MARSRVPTGAAHLQNARRYAAQWRSLESGVPVQYLVIEHFRHSDPVPVYQRFRERGRLAPDGLVYVGSWITEDLARCYQVMEAPNRALLDQWIAQWKDLVDFEVHAVLTSAQVLERLAPQLTPTPRDGA